MDPCFKLVNLDKREYVCPSCMSEGAALWSWAIGRHSGVLNLLICSSSLDRKDSDDSPSYVITGGDRPVVIAEVYHKSIFKDGTPIPSPASAVIGRWTGDRVYLRSDADDAKYRDELRSYTNITKQLVRGWNEYIHGKNAQLSFRYCGCKENLSDSPTNL